MRVIANTSDWRTDDIMRLARRVAEHELDPEHRKHVRITIKRSRRHACHSGKASLGLPVYLKGEQVDVLLGRMHERSS